MTNIRNIKVFVSHSHNDTAVADHLRRLLRALPDVSVFSADDLNVGQSWREQLRKAIVESHVFLLVATPSAIASPSVLQELGAAWALDKQMIWAQTSKETPVRLPVELQHGRIINLT